jgi:HD-like signal output (HDOD) protein
LARWNFPDNLVAAVWHHHDPRKAAPHEHLAAYVYLGNMIAHLLGHGYGHQAYALTGRIEALEMLKVTPDGFAEYMIQTQVRWEKVQSLLRVA